eukprot:5493951-Pyramimonas_sp.AAC.1
MGVGGGRGKAKMRRGALSPQNGDPTPKEGWESVPDAPHASQVAHIDSKALRERFQTTHNAPKMLQEGPKEPSRRAPGATHRRCPI